MDKNNSDLIEATYQLVLRTSTYDEFLGAWDDSDIFSEPDISRGKAADGIVNKDFSRLLEQAIKVIEEVKKVDPEEEEFFTLSNSAAAPTAIVSRRGVIMSTSDDFAEKSGVAVGNRIGDLVLDPSQAKRLQQGLREIGEARPSQLLALVRADLDDDLRPSLISLVAASSETAFLSISVPKFTDELRSVAGDLFDLSEVEIAVLSAIIEGVELQEVASLRGRSIETIRSQLKSIFRKVGARSQAELVGIFLTIPKFLALSEDQPTQYKPIEHSLSREDGRLVCYTTTGPATGHPVVIFHAMTDGAKLPASTRALFVNAGLQIITPARPSFGKSGRIDDPKKAMNVVADDCRAILDKLGIKGCVLVGQMGGAVFAAATAALLGDRVRAVVNIAGTIPFVSDSQFEEMTRGQRVLARTYINAPALAAFVLRAGIALVRDGKESRLFEAQFPKDSPDYEVMQRPEIFEALRQGYRFAFYDGHHGNYTDAYSILSDWTETADKIKQPIICLHGDSDPVTPIRFVQDYVNGAENRSLVEIRKSAQLILHAEPELVVKTLQSIFDEH